MITIFVKIGTKYILDNLSIWMLQSMDISTLRLSSGAGASPGTLNVPIQLPRHIPIGKGQLTVDVMISGTNELVDRDAVEIRTR